MMMIWERGDSDTHAATGAVKYIQRVLDCQTVIRNRQDI